MKQRVADFIADYMVDYGIQTCFTVVGGGAMHLNDAFGHKAGLQCVYNHHEQACAMAAEAYARIDNRPALVCVTSGPGGTNAITGVLGAWLDSLPMLVISGQVRYDTTARSTGLPLRAMGDQEFDITKAIECMTKFSCMVTDKTRIRYMLEKALYLATNSRMGPCWLDIPRNIQSATIDTDELQGFDPAELNEAGTAPNLHDETVAHILKRLTASQRPVFYAGSGIRLAGATGAALRLAEALQMPIVTCGNSIDFVETAHPLYIGRAGIMGDRAGNFAVQNADVLLCIGNRLSIKQVGYNWMSWAPDAYTVVVDVDEAELKKPLVHIDCPVHCDAKVFVSSMLALADQVTVTDRREWLTICQNWRAGYPVVSARHYQSQDANVYAFIDVLSSQLPEGSVTVAGVGSARVVGSQAYVIQKGARFLCNSAVASMGYDLPAATGACIALGGKDLVCITGDGSLQMNLQELQTILTNHLPIRLYVINNRGYHSIRQTQGNYFANQSKIGIGPDSGDLGFPSLEKIAYAYGYPYYAIRHNAELFQTVSETLRAPAPLICEVFVTIDQAIEPRSLGRAMPDGTIFSPPLEDLYPFLPREELARNMIVKRVCEP